MQYLTGKYSQENVGETGEVGPCGEGAGKGFQDRGTHVHTWLIHVNAWQKPPKGCKVISFQLK